jgi:hypothetical protein
MGSYDELQPFVFEQIPVANDVSQNSLAPGQSASVEHGRDPSLKAVHRRMPEEVLSQEQSSEHPPAPEKER